MAEKSCQHRSIWSHYIHGQKCAWWQDGLAQCLHEALWAWHADTATVQQDPETAEDHSLEPWKCSCSISPVSSTVAFGNLTAHESRPRVLQAAITWTLVFNRVKEFTSGHWARQAAASSFHLSRFDGGPRALEPAHFRVGKMWKLN